MYCIFKMMMDLHKGNYQQAEIRIANRNALRQAQGDFQHQGAKLTKILLNVTKVLYTLLCGLRVSAGNN